MRAGCKTVFSVTYRALTFFSLLALRNTASSTIYRFKNNFPNFGRLSVAGGITVLFLMFTESMLRQ